MSSPPTRRAGTARALPPTPRSAASATEEKGALMAPAIRTRIRLPALCAIPILLAVTFGTYVMLFSIGDAAAVVAGESATPEQVEQIRSQLGLDQPVLLQYLTWLGEALRGDLG